MILNSKKYISFSFTFMLLFSSLILLSTSIKSQDNQLYLNIIDIKEEPINEIYEDEQFKVSVYIINDDHTPEFQQNVSVFYNGKTYLLTDLDPEILLIAPIVTTNTILNITASKEGYKTINQTITILNKLSLKITPESYTLEANKRFSVVVTDEYDNPVSGVTVGIQSYSEKNTIDTTNDYGRAWLTAPEKRDEIVIKAQKEGYADASTTLVVNINPTFIEELTSNSLTPIIFAISLLIIVILIVYFKQRKSHEFSNLKKENLKNGKFPELKQNKSIEHNKIDNNESQKVRIITSKEPKIEEIRITKPKNQKEIIKSSDEKITPKPVRFSKDQLRKSNCNWFEGTEDFRYQIDKMTGKVDEKGKDKWFEGKNDIRKAIDDKIKKRDREKEK